MMAIAAGIVELLEDYKDPDDLDEFSVITLQVTLDSSVSGADSDDGACAPEGISTPWKE